MKSLEALTDGFQYVPNGEITMPGDEKRFRFSRYAGWQLITQPGWKVRGDMVRRRIRHTPSKAENLPAQTPIPTAEEKPAEVPAYKVGDKVKVIASTYLGGLANVCVGQSGEVIRIGGGGVCQVQLPGASCWYNPLDLEHQESSGKAEGPSSTSGSVLSQEADDSRGRNMLGVLADYVEKLTDSWGSSKPPHIHLEEFITSLQEKLAEAEKWAEQLTGEKFSERNHGALQCRAVEAEKMVVALEQKLRTAEAAIPKWTACSEMMPTESDADGRNFVWWLRSTTGEVVARHWRISFEAAELGQWDHWMTPIPLPSPTPLPEEDAFKKWWGNYCLDANAGYDASDKSDHMREAFLAGRASASV